MRYRKNIKGGEKKIIDQKAILKTVSRGTALFLAAVLFAGSILTGCASTEKSSKSRKNNGSADHEITVAINSETGSLDPAGSIALTYLAYSVSALDELLTFDENGEILTDIGQPVAEIEQQAETKPDIIDFNKKKVGN